MKKELLIFGSGGALGKGISDTLIKKDYDKVYLFDFKPDISIQNKKVEAILVNDLTHEENVVEAFNAVKPGKDKILFLYSTVGGYFGGKNIWETEVADWDKMFNMNLKTSFLIAKHFSKIVKESAAGSIFFTAAFTGLNPEVKKAAYGVSKGALIHIVKTLALEGKEIKLTANAIAPLIIDTPANREWMKGGYDSWIKPEEIGELIHGIFSNFNFVTGNIIQLTERFVIE
ncbi:MAG: SDR family NAD(P)-dependent oxidoreductase [Ignavibacteriaceae bacterium]